MVVETNWMLFLWIKITGHWIKDLDMRPDTVKFSEENIGQTLSDINDSNIFSDPPPRIMTIKTKVNKWDLIKLKSFCIAKETLNKMKRQPTEWEKIFASESTGKGLISKIYKQLLPTAQYQKKKNNPIKNWAEDLNRQFSKEDIQMAKKHMRRCSTSLVIREMQNQNYCEVPHLTPARMAIIQKSTKRKCWRGVEKKEPYLHC